MKKIYALALALMLLNVTAWAVPAKPGLVTVPQSDGTMLQIQTLGDEFHHCFATADGLTLDRGSDGDMYYLSAKGLTAMRAHNARERSAAENAFLEQHAGQFTMSALARAMQASGKMRSRHAAGAKRVGQTQVPTIGSPRVPIILIEYYDKKMSNTKAQLQAHYTTDAKSAYQYFADQSNGKYTPQFDVYGIYSLDETRATYGANSGGNDVGVARMVGEAIDKAGDDIDWSLYDNDGDGEADVCIVVYAGVGEAQASTTVPNSIWPCQWDLESGQAYNDGTGPRERNGVKINRFAVFNEVSGAYDTGTTLDGIGTFCHEFSHCLGLPDFYATNYGGYYGMGNWSLMCSGCYNGGAVRGDTPVGYSAYEKNFMGWIDFITPVNNTQYTLPVFNSKNIETDKAIKMTGFNENEYWILENRRKQGWDEYIADEGVLITHFTYVESRWNDNTPNNNAVQLATVIAADNTLSKYDEGGDLYGEIKHELTSTSTPAIKANMYADGTLASTTGGAGVITDKQVTNIYLNADGTASLWYNLGKEVPQLTDTTAVTSTGFTAHWSEVENVESYTLQVSDVDYVQPVQLLASLDGSAYTGNYADITLDAPWGGNNIKGGSNAIYFNTSSYGNVQGCITYTVPEGYDNAIFTLKLTTVNSGYGEGNFTVATPLTPAAGIDFAAGETHAWVVAASSGQNITITTTDYSYSPDIALIEIYSGDATAQALRAPVEAGDEHVRTITGITGNSYTVQGLGENGLYDVKVKALYTDGTRSEWSDTWQVQLHGSGIPGDVNLDGRVDVDDVNIVVAIILGKDQAENYDRRAYVNDDDNIDVDDVDALVRIILNK